MSLDGSNGFVINGIDGSDSSGFSVSDAGDVNGDGVDDVIIGATNADPNGVDRAGESYIVFGSNTGFSPSLDLSSLNGSNGFVINGINASDSSGRSVSSAGDVNGDGFDDVVIGASAADPNGNFSGQSYVVFGSGNPAASLDLSSLDGSNGFTINGINSSDSFGLAISNTGDINGDGIGDILLGALGANNEAGESYVIFGNTNGFTANFDLLSLDGSNGFVIPGVDSGDISGNAVSNAGDINNDGIDDIIIGAKRADLNGNFSVGESYVIFGSPSGFNARLDLASLDGSNGFIINGIDNGDESGNAVSHAGDVNGDGIDDIIIAAYEADPNGNSDSGENYVVFGRSSGFTASFDLSDIDGSNGFIIQGIDTDDNSGFSVSGAGDINNDGFADVIIGTRFFSFSDTPGESYVLFGFNSATTTNFAPGAIDDAFNTDEDINVTGNVLANDTDTDGDPLTLIEVNGIAANVGSQITLASGALLTLNADGTYSYNPNAQFESLNDGDTATDSFTYTITDGSETDSATVTITINGIDEPVSDSLTVDILIDEDDNNLSVGDVSLRDALKAIADGGTIDFSNSLANGTITLDPTLGELVVDKSVTINGLGADQLTIDAAGNSRVFKIDDARPSRLRTVSIDGLTITGGTTSDAGGGLNNNENLTISNSSISGNSGFFSGGIENTGTANISNSVISGNRSNLYRFNYYYGIAGGISNSGTLNISSSTITDNRSAANYGGAGGIVNIGIANITSSTISGNSSGALSSDAGGINNTGTVSITDSTISGNISADPGFGNADGGGIRNSGTANINNSTITNNTSRSSRSFGGGGGILADGITNITSSTISGNSASSGYSGIFNRGKTNIIDSTINNNVFSFGSYGFLTTLNLTNSTLSNTAGSGLINQQGVANITSSTISNHTRGGIFNSIGTANVINSTISGNAANKGGGIFNIYGTTNVINSTVSGNTANKGGGIFNAESGNVNVTNSTITSNSASSGGGGIYNYFAYTNITSSIISDVANDSSDFSVFTSGGNNLISNSGSVTSFINGVNGDIVGTAATPIDPVLGPLQDNGGPTETQAILEGSPAINAGSNPENLTIDQRGEARVQQGAIDIGAFESDLLPPVSNQPPNAVDDAVNTDEDTAITGDVLTNDTDPDSDPLIVTEVNGNAADVGSQITLASGALLTLNADGTYSYNPNSQFESLNTGDTATDSFTYTITDGSQTDIATVTVSIDGITDIGINEIVGTSGRDHLTGTDQSDRITGLQSRDTITGGAGDDIFSYTSLVDAGDIITDFEVGSDKIDLVGVLNSVGFAGVDPIAEGYVGFRASRGVDTILTIDPDGATGSGSVRSFILVQGVTSAELNNSDSFIF